MLDSHDMHRIQDVARAWTERASLPSALAPFEALRFRAEHMARNYVSLHLDDVSAIPFLQDIVGVELYQLRAAVRASDGDMIASTCPPLLDYQLYNRDHLNLGDPTVIHADPGPIPPSKVSQALIANPDALDTILEIASKSGGLIIHPYMGSEDLWNLAATLHARRPQLPIHVLAPPPPITWLANDKHTLTQIAHDVAGPESVLPTFGASTPEKLATHMRSLASIHRRVALKMTRCASAMGNAIFLSKEINAWSDEELLQHVSSFLRDKEWKTGEIVLAMPWADTTSSPSTQLWIPPLGAGPVRLDGIYEQLLEGDEQMFLGSVPSRLNQVTHDALIRDSLLVASVFQELGYVGRCSFDFIVLGDSDTRFIECNGRWGGTSTPMHLLDRLFPDGRPPYRAQDYISPALVGSSFQEVADRLRPYLYDPTTGQGQLILYNTGCLKPYGKLDVIAIADSVEEASDLLRDQLPGWISPR